MIAGVTIAGHTGRLVIEPITSTDNAAAIWLRPANGPATCVWLTSHQLRALAEHATNRADWLATNEPYACQVRALIDPMPAPEPRTRLARILDRLGVPAPGRPETST